MWGWGPSLRGLLSFGLQEPISGKVLKPSVGLSQGLPQTGSHLTAFGQGKAPTQQDQDIPGHLIVHCLPGEDGRRSLQLPWFFYSPSRQGWSPKVNRPPLPSFLSGFLSELKAGRRESSVSHLCRIPTLSLSPCVFGRSPKGALLAPAKCGQRLYTCRQGLLETLPSPRPAAYLGPGLVLESGRV